MMQFAKERLHVSTFRAKVLEHNGASLKLFAKCGFLEVCRKDIFKEVWLEKTLV